MGFTHTNSDTGIKDEDLKAVLEGEIPTYHEFNSSERTGDQNKEENKPHCVIIVVSADAVQNMQLNNDSVLTTKMKNLHSFIPSDVTRIVVLTKCDTISDLVHKSITNIYTCQTIYSVVQKATKIFGTQESMVFPIVNYFKEWRLDREKNVPILYALMFALNFAADRQELRP
ncbi:IFI44-like protein [Mya arenaria]|uniref:IFI44-like protein n=1 Tax=Mya arenaria TaxID=6604 RepID=A0ABY7FUX4_MYAAR|nr:IFI44-like protein [Mya arenaria]